MEKATPTFPSTARALFGAGPDTTPASPGTPITTIRTFYADPLAWIGLLVSTAVLTYAGGAVMFWFHAVYLGEGGPAVSAWWHWLLDSSAGFVALAPAVAVILPVAARWLSQRSTPPGARVRPTRFALLAGTLFALVTAPAPLFHDRFISQGTPLADAVTRLLGNGSAPTGEPQDVSAAVEMLQQVGVGIPTYVVLTWVAVVVVRALVRLGVPRAVRVAPAVAWAGGAVASGGADRVPDQP